MRDSPQVSSSTISLCKVFISINAATFRGRKGKVNVANERVVLRYVAPFFIQRWNKGEGSQFCSVEVINTRLILEIKWMGGSGKSQLRVLALMSLKWKGCTGTCLMSWC